MKKFVIVISILLIILLIVLGVYLYKKDVAETAIDTYITKYGIPKNAIRKEAFGYAHAPPGFVKRVYTDDTGDEIHYNFQYFSWEKKVHFSVYIEGTEVGIDDPRAKKLKYPPPASMQNQ
ncbi:DUF3139 domain-containing protein [Listeria rustica]|uniref:DUF3139 domain-containing protein n=1 Tax=Listeria rustica TaxID=2713503 RepID=A0A7W1YEP7_9LIST|nr:DUF3139 domain-containing protein [Listeria rustica]MBA3924812.1 DUF3139 domain-containing protein [Listeria rustica]